MRMNKGHSSTSRQKSQIENSMMVLINYKINTEAEELMTQWLRAFLILAKNPVSIPSTHMETHHLLHTRHV